MADRLTCLVISDGRRGIENQALGLAEALGRLRDIEITRYIVKPRSLFEALPAKLQFTLKSSPGAYGIDYSTDIAIGCGRQAIAPLLALKKSYGADIFTVYVQNPRIDPKHFDLVIAPEHDRLSGANIETMIGSPNRITVERLQAEVRKFAEKLAGLPTPRVAVLIGGTSKTHTLTQDIHRKHMRAICALAEQGMSIMLTTSRRTPAWAVADYHKITADREAVWVWDNKGDNPYFAFLCSADAILVTEDSTNMLTEACATGKPVFRLPMAGDAGKFATLYDNLEKRCHVTLFKGKITAKPYTQLDETGRMAENLIMSLDNTGAR